MSSLRDNNNKTPLELFIEKNLPKVLEEQTKDQLGDRSTYIGASDIGGCLRKVFLSKQQKPDYDIAQHIVFERGHIAEGIVEKMLKGTPYKTKIEVSSLADNGFPIKAHIDFMVENKDECVIIEAKSTSTPVSEPYESWILQTQLQMGLVLKTRNRKSVRGYVIAIDVNTGWYKTFIVDFNKTLFNIAMTNANTLANALKTRKTPTPSIQMYCSKCPFKSNCPAIAKGVEKQLPTNIKSIVYKLKTLQKVDSEIRQLKKELISFMEATNTQIAKSGNAIVQLCQSKNDSYSIDTGRLRVEQPDIYAKYRKPSKSFNYLKVI